MSAYNWASDSGSSKTASQTKGDVWDGGSVTGSAGNVFDDDTSTVYTTYLYDAPATSEDTARVEQWLNAESDFPSAVNINKIVAVVNYGAAGGGTVYAKSYTVSAYYASAWHVVGTGNMSGSKQTLTFDSLGLSGVSKVKIQLHGDVSSSVGNNAESWLYAYELQAFGSVYTDIGLRIKGSSTVTIGGETLDSSHKLRFRKGTTTYGIPLLATTDLDASGLRIYDGSAVKALPKKT